MKGLTTVAPAWAPRRAWLAEKQSVWLTRMPSALRVAMASMPWMVLGILTHGSGIQPAMSRPSSTIPWVSVETTSTEIGTVDQIEAISETAER